jgi:hypothetical protein
MHDIYIQEHTLAAGREGHAPTYETAIDLTDAFCAEHLRVECRDLARPMSVALCRKRPSPVTAGYSQYFSGTATMPSDKGQVAQQYVEIGLVP